MAKRITSDEYFELLKVALNDSIKGGEYHPEDIGVAVEVANETLWKVLSIL